MERLFQALNRREKSFQFRLLKESDSFRIDRLNDRLLNEPEVKEWYCPVREDLRECLSRRGFGVGVYQGKELVGYRLVRYAGMWEENLSPLLGRQKVELKHLAQFAGFSVRPEERGRGLGSKMFSLSLDILKEKGYRSAVGTCHRQNRNSLSIFLKNDFDIVKSIERYGEKRYLLLKDLRGTKVG